MTTRKAAWYIISVVSVCLSVYVCMYNCIYRVTQNKIPHQTICNISATSGLILKILETA